MCEQTEVDYLDGDVVWVKLGTCWWPGEVRDLVKLPPEIVTDFKKPPIAVVKFFQEDQYEYVKNINHIYKYNCRKKNEFIKKGLDMHKAKIAFMDKFPTDICTAESLTGGDPDIITSDEFALEQKHSYSAIFGTSPKKQKSGPRGRHSVGTPKSGKQPVTPRITHRRFVGKSDHEVRILEQTTPVAATSHYTCHICGFESTRLNVIVLHNRSHSNGTYVSPTKQKTKKNGSAKKGKRPKTFATTNSIDEDLELIRQGVTVTVEESSDSESEKEQEKIKTGAKRKGSKTSNSASKKAKVSSICNNLLADWGDSDSNEETIDKPDAETTENKTEISESKIETTEKKSETIENRNETAENINETTKTNEGAVSVHNELLADWEDKNSDDGSTGNSDKIVLDENKSETKSNEKASCFDFEDEEGIDVLEKSPGRKIPRVIPPKRISKDAEENTETDQKTEDTADDAKTLGLESKDENNSEEKNDASEDELTAFKSILEETAVPEISAIPEVDDKITGTSKKMFDKKSDDSGSVDKTNGVLKTNESDLSTEIKENEVDKESDVSITTVPKKRMVKSFEEFENLLNEQKQPDDDDDSVQSKSTLEVSKLKSQLMSKLNDSPVKQSSIENEESDTDFDKIDETMEDCFPRKFKFPRNESDKDSKKKEPEIVSKKIDFSELPDEKIESEDSQESLPEPVTEAFEELPEKVEEPELEVKTETPEEIIEEPIEMDIEPIEENKQFTEETVEVNEPLCEDQDTFIDDKDAVIEEKEMLIEEKEVLIEEKEKDLCEPNEILPELEVKETISEELPDDDLNKEFQDECDQEKKPEDLPTTEEVSQKNAEETRSQKMLVDISDICIDNSDNLSGLSTLAAVSELSGNLYDKSETISQEFPVSESKDEAILDEVINPPSTVTDESESRETSSVPEEMLDASVADKQVATLANFSMDFSDSNSESTIIKNVSENVIEEKISETVETSVTSADSEEIKIEEPNDSLEKSNQNSLITSDVPTDFESIESEIEKITSIETNSDKLNSFPENISQVTQDCISLDSTGISYSEFPLTETAETVTTTIATEGTDFEAKIDEVNTETTLESEIAKLTDTQPETETVFQEQQNTSSSKLLEILTDSKRSDQIQTESPTQASRSIISSGGSQKVQMIFSGDSKAITKKFDSKSSKLIIKSSTSKTPGISNKPIILSEKIIKPVTEIENVSVKKVTSKRTYQDVEDIDTFIIQKPSKKVSSGDNDQQDIILTPKSETLKFKSTVRARGKPKIIEQTIIKAADIVQQVPVAVTNESQTLLDDSMFDINAMPIVLSDQILTPESIENMPVVMTNLMPTSSVSSGANTVQTVIAEKSQQSIVTKRTGAMQKQVKILNKEKVSTSQSEGSQKMTQNVVKNIIPRGLGKNQKVYQTGSKLLKNHTAVITQPGKPGKFIILPSTTTASAGSKYTVGKRASTVKTMQTISSPTTSKQLKSVQSVPSVPTGNKIMIVTNQHGEQSRVLLTPAQQKLFACKMPSTKVAKSPSQHMKGGVMQKSILTSKGTIIAPVNSGLKSNLASQTIVTSKGQMFTTHSGQTLVTSEGQVLTPITQQQLKSLKTDQHKPGKKIQMQSSRVLLPDKSAESLQKGKMNILGTKTKTILIKGSQGQTLKKIQSPANESKNILLSQGGHKTSQLMSIGGQHIQGGVGKQVVVTSKGQIIKSSEKISLSKQAFDKMQKMHSSKATLSTPPRIVSKNTSRTQVLLSPVSGSSTNKSQLASNVAVPPLAPITAGQTKKDIMSHSIKQSEQKLLNTLSDSKEKLADMSAVATDKSLTGEQKQPNQLIIQDAMGNQTTVTEGQILALPSGETVDGQPQSYVLVTVDETGNLVPISNDTLMSLDPNLALGGDMNNIVLQIDQGAQENQAQDAKPAETLPAPELPVDDQQFMTTTQTTVDSADHQQLLSVDNQQLMISDQSLLPTTSVSEAETQLTAEQQQQVLEHQETFVTNTEENQVITSDAVSMMQDAQQTAVACSINNGDSSQQLIITGDPESTQKFLASLSEGNTDLSSLLSGTDGNIIINTDGQQILLNTDSENQILLSVNSDNLGLIQGSTEGDAAANSMYVTQQAIKNQDILAAALADTDVFQQESSGDKQIVSQALTKVSSSTQSQLSPNSSLYPMNVGNVLETSLTLGSPIMTPLEVPSVNNKKINPDVESTLLTQVPSSLELPITITDPSISQTVSQQVMLGNDLQTNLDLPITMSDTGITSIRSSEINSPSFVYSLPTLDESSDLDQKRVFAETSTVMTTDIYNTSLTGSMSMPLLTEDPEVPAVEQEQISTSHEEIPITTAPETSTTTEAIISESDPSENYPTISSDNLENTIAEKMPNDLQIDPIEEELDLNQSDICSSLSEPPPGMFDKSSFSNYLNNKEDEEEESNISLPQETTTLEETATSTNDSCILNEPVISLPILTDGAETEPETVTTDILTTPVVTEKPTDEPNLEMDYGVTESSEQQSISETQEVQQRSDLSETPNSELNSPRLDIDENSGEIPIQPPIITNLSATFDESAGGESEYNSQDESKKRVHEDTDNDENDLKRTKLSCD